MTASMNSLKKTLSVLRRSSTSETVKLFCIENDYAEAKRNGFACPVVLHIDSYAVGALTHHTGVQNRYDFTYGRTVQI